MVSPKDDALRMLVLEAMLADLAQEHSQLKDRLRQTIADAGHGVAVVLPSTGGRIANITPTYRTRKPVPYVHSPSLFLDWARANRPQLIREQIAPADESAFLSTLAPVDRDDAQPEAADRDGQIVDGVRFMWRSESTGIRTAWVQPTSERLHGREMLRESLERGELQLPPLPVRWELDA